ncbi:MAG TPA: sigma 54-interacting transcriptional regulator, partial [Myxococcaceae bacterium]|nr:sigma 54-interacting transcriptional regulator [Myxococcaceae bacterium]
RRFRFTVLEGPQPGQTKDSNADTFSLGSHALNDLVLDEPTVSRFHCEVKIDRDGARVRDLDSRNGTMLDGVHVREAWLRGGSVLRLGRVSVRFDFSPESNRLLISEKTTFGELVGTSAVSRASFALMERAAASDATVLLEGETGTGKSRAALSIHRASARASGPFLTVDCGAIPGNLLESELFGHEKGSFTGATTTKLGKFELAEDGTVFLDEIGDMSLMLQAKLLRVLQEREFERVGGVKRIKLRARVIAATHRTLADEVATGRFREDLYQRLKVITLQIPPLRDRPEDIPLLVHHLLERINEKVHKRVTRVPPEVLQHLSRLPWRGNVRELENVLTRAVVLAPGEVLLGADLPALEPGSEPDRALPSSGPMFAPPPVDDPSQIPTLDEAERMLIQRAMAVTKGHKGKTCQILGISRPTLERKLQKYGLSQSVPSSLG